MQSWVGCQAPGSSGKACQGLTGLTEGLCKLSGPNIANLSGLHSMYWQLSLCRHLLLLEVGVQRPSRHKDPTVRLKGPRHGGFQKPMGFGRILVVMGSFGLP